MGFYHVASVPLARTPKFDALVLEARAPRPETLSVSPKFDIGEIMREWRAEVAREATLAAIQAAYDEANAKKRAKAQNA